MAWREKVRHYLARGDRRAVVAVDIHGGIYAVARWSGVRTKDVASRTGDLKALPSVQEAQEHLAGLVHEKMADFITDITDEFSRAAQALEGRRYAMVECHRAAGRDLQVSHERHRLDEMKQRAARFRSGIRGLWDRLTGQHAKLREQNELEAAAFAARDADEKQALVDHQIGERRRLQQQILQERRTYAHEMARPPADGGIAEAGAGQLIQR